jgi:hypothetical protein
MKYRHTLPLLGLAIAASVALAQNPQDKKPTAPAQPPAGHDMPQLPPGWTEADMQACMEAATPGEMHAFLAESIGTWTGKSKMWMAPGVPPMESECTSKITALLDGRFTKCEIEGEMPGMGPFHGFGIYGYDNVGKKFQSTWIDNCGTGMMQGTGELSSDEQTLTWKFTYNCPITKKPTTMREIERNTGKNTKTLEMHGIDPKSGKEFKMMEIAFTRSGGGDAHASLGMISDKTVEAGCSMCVFHVAGAKSCDLAVKLDGKTYMVNGAKVDAHQFCSGAKKCVVSGKIEGDKFVATKFDVKPATP